MYILIVTWSNMKVGVKIKYVKKGDIYKQWKMKNCYYFTVIQNYYMNNYKTLQIKLTLLRLILNCSELFNIKRTKTFRIVTNFYTT